MTKGSTKTRIPKNETAKSEVKVTFKKLGPLAYEMLDAAGKPLVCRKCGRKLVARFSHVSSSEIKKVCEIPQLLKSNDE